MLEISGVLVPVNVEEAGLHKKRRNIQKQGQQRVVRKKRAWRTGRKTRARKKAEQMHGVMGWGREKNDSVKFLPPFYLRTYQVSLISLVIE